MEDLKLQLKDVREQLEKARKRCQEQRFLAKKGEAYLKFFKQRMDRWVSSRLIFTERNCHRSLVRIAPYRNDHSVKSMNNGRWHT